MEYVLKVTVNNADGTEVDIDPNMSRAMGVDGLIRHITRVVIGNPKATSFVMVVSCKSHTKEVRGEPDAESAGAV